MVKKILSQALILISLATLAACNQSTPNKTQETSDRQESKKIFTINPTFIDGNNSSD